MLTPHEVETAIRHLSANDGLTKLCAKMDWRDISPLAEAMRLRLVNVDLGRDSDLIHAYSIQARTETSQFPMADWDAKYRQRDRQLNGLVRLCSKCTDHFIIYYAFPTTEVIPLPKPLA
jgi:hypothetical protein